MEKPQLALCLSSRCLAYDSPVERNVGHAGIYPGFLQGVGKPWPCQCNGQTSHPATALPFTEGDCVLSA